LLLLALFLLVVFQQAAGMLMWSETRLFQAVSSGAHVPWFALVTLAICELSRNYVLVRKRQYATVIAACLMLAVGTEIMQLYTSRNASLADVGRNVMGMLTGLSIFTLVRRHGVLSFNVRAALAALCVAGLLVAIAPAMYHAAVRVYLSSIAPELIRLDSRLGRAPVRFDRHVDVVDGGVLAPALAGSPMLRVKLPDRQWPGITFREPLANWSGYDELSVGVYVAGDEGISLTVRLLLDDGLGPLRRVWMPVGTSELRVPLVELFPESSGKGARVRELVVYAERQAAGRVVAIQFARLI
jgi:hypothetical protein